MDGKVIPFRQVKPAVGVCPFELSRKLRAARRAGLPVPKLTPAEEAAVRQWSRNREQETIELMRRR